MKSFATYSLKKLNGHTDIKEQTKNVEVYGLKQKGLKEEDK